MYYNTLQAENEGQIGEQNFKDARRIHASNYAMYLKVGLNDYSYPFQ